MLESSRFDSASERKTSGGKIASHHRFNFFGSRDLKRHRDFDRRDLQPAADVDHEHLVAGDRSLFRRTRASILCSVGEKETSLV